MDLLTLRRKIIDKEFTHLNEMQKDAVYTTHGAVLILAGAGSGKTTVLVNRISYLLKYGNAYKSGDISLSGDINEDTRILSAVYDGSPLSEEEKIRANSLLSVGAPPPWAVMAITFTNKAAAELKERISKSIGEERAFEVWASTFHSACVKILRKELGKVDFSYTSDFTIYDSDDSKRVIKECMKALNTDDKVLPIKLVQNVISGAKDKLISPNEFISSAENDVRLKQIGNIYLMYQNRLSASNALDFDDIIMKTVELFEEYPDILDKYRKRFKYILVDEYQDTNLAQFKLVNLLAGEKGNLCVVGDDDQSIYKFRGATIENILQFDKTYPAAKVIRLEQNYRSTQNILSAANDVISHNIGRKGKTLWTDKGSGELITDYCGDNERDEAYFIGSTILQGITRENKSGKDFAILYRNNAMSNIIETTLAKMGIPYRVIGGHRFYERKEIKDAIAYLSVINNPNDDVRLKRIINEPKRAIGGTTIEAAEKIAGAEGKSIYSVISQALNYPELSRAAVKLLNFTEMIEKLRIFSEASSLRQLYTYMLDITGYIEMYRAENTPEALDRIENLNELLSSIDDFCEDYGEEASLRAFLEEVSLMTDIDNYDTSAETVTLMTVHAAKGLEFPVVFVAGMEEGVFPGRQAVFEPSEIEEERRLAYVAITRAIEKLYLTHARCRTLYGQTMPGQASRFIKEIDPLLLDEQGISLRENKYSGGLRENYSTPVKTSKIQPSKTKKTIFDNTKAPPEKVDIGDRVKHKAFGEGTVLSLKPMGNDILIEVEFDKVGIKKLMSNFAGLKKL